MEKNVVRLEEYLRSGVENIVKGIIRASLKYPKTSIFMAKYAAGSRRAEAKRKQARLAGDHVPPFLIASITEECNLHCRGCYARANSICGGSTDDMCCTGSTQDRDSEILASRDWDNVFMQAEDMGISFILLAGGEPFLRKDVLARAGGHQNILFPVFTNGTMIDDDSMDMLDSCRNLVPVISIEGDMAATDARRGAGVFAALEETMEKLRKAGILFGASVTVTKQNMEEVLSDDFISKLKRAGAKAIVYVEYVPVDELTGMLAPDEKTRADMMERLDVLRSSEKEMIFIAFPGDEEASGGCLAAGRGFFHINPRGGAEPCPFSPYSDLNVTDVSLKEALGSGLFRTLREQGHLALPHNGGCALYEQRERVQAIAEGNMA
ncbi:MAG: radical SAM protein [Eubacteriaceae bacterium]|nr:radical SAM protein [Eubacteriaceae bacterium]